MLPRCLQLLFAVALVSCVGKVPDDPRPANGDEDDDDATLAVDAGVSTSSPDARPPGAPDARPSPPDAQVAAAEYPSGPYGTRAGDVIENLSWVGYVDDDGNGNPFDDPPRTLSLEELYRGNDPDARLIFINSSAGWCGSCQDEAAALPGLHADYGPRGVRFISALFQDTGGSAATTSWVRTWGQTFDLPMATVADPNDLLSAYYEESAVPMNMLIDAETMRIVEVHHGFDPYYTRSLFDAHVD